MNDKFCTYSIKKSTSCKSRTRPRLPLGIGTYETILKNVQVEEASITTGADVISKFWHNYDNLMSLK